MRDGVQIGGNEFRVVFVDAELCVLNLVVIDGPIKADNDRAHVVVDGQFATGSHFGLLIGILRSTNVRNINQIQFLTNTNFPNDVNFFARIVKLGLFQVRCCRKGTGKDFVRWNIRQSQGIKLFLVPLATLGGIVGDKKQLFAGSPEFGEGFGNAVNERVALLVGKKEKGKMRVSE